MDNKIMRINILEFLKYHYGKEFSEPVELSEIADSLGITKEDASANLRYMIEKSWVEPHEGLREAAYEIKTEGIDALDELNSNSQSEIDTSYVEILKKSQPAEKTNLRELIIKTEEDLRDLVSSVLSREYGSSWGNDPTKGWSKNKKQELEHRLKLRQEEFRTKSISTRLIDYCYILDLKELIKKNEKIFKIIFHDWDRMMTFFDEIGKFRNPPMHSTTALLSHEESLCIGICGEFKQIMEHWKKGFSRKILLYAGNLNFDVLENGNEQEVQKQALDLANNWIHKIKALSNDKIETISTDQGESIVVRLEEGIVTIRLPNLTRSYNGTYAQTAGVYFKTKSKDVLSKIISIGQHSYWHLEWIITDDLDVHSLISKVEESTGKKPSSTSGTGSPPNVRWNMADYGISNSVGKRVRAHLTSIDSTKSKIGITCDDSMFDKGFIKAHEVFSPDSILSIIYGEIPLEQKFEK